MKKKGERLEILYYDEEEIAVTLDSQDFAETMDNRDSADTRTF